MSQLDDFLTQALARQLDAEQALISGDPGPRLAMWSTQDPVTVLGAMKDVIGAEEARQAFRWLATRFSNCTDYRFELVAAGASGDLAYTVGYEHTAFSMDGGPVAPLTLRVTHVYRREDGEWKVVHRHADTLMADQTAPPRRPRRREKGKGKPVHRQPDDAPPPDLSRLNASGQPAPWPQQRPTSPTSSPRRCRVRSKPSRPGTSVTSTPGWRCGPPGNR